MERETMQQWVTAALVTGAALVASQRGALAGEMATASPPAVATAQATAAVPTPRLSARQRKIREALVGRWKLEDGEDELEFRPDGWFVGKSHSMEMTAKYEISADGKLIIDLGLPVPRKAQGAGTGQAESNATPTPRTLRVVREVRFKGNKLVLHDRDSGQSFRYRRLP